MNELLNVEHLSISFHTYNGEVQAVRDASFRLGRGEVLAVVGESGSGKSVMMQTILKLTPCELKGGTITFDGLSLIHICARSNCPGVLGMHPASGSDCVSTAT